MLTSWFTQLRSRLLPGKMALLVLFSAACGAGLTAGIPPLWQWLEGTHPTPAPAPAVDKTFIPLGRTYLSNLGQQYAAAWIEGAKALESGQPISVALKDVAQSWDKGRGDIFGRLLTPEFTKIVPEGHPETDTKTADLQAMARAWRGLAAGLSARPRLFNWP